MASCPVKGSYLSPYMYVEVGHLPPLYAEGLAYLEPIGPYEYDAKPIVTGEEVEEVLDLGRRNHR